MNTLIITLLILSLFLFIISFFQKDPYKQLEEEVEELSITILKEQYQLNKRIKILEEELLIEKDFFEETIPAKSPPHTEEINEILKNQVLSLYNQGISFQQISTQSSLSVETVKKIIEAYSYIGRISQ